MNKKTEDILREYPTTDTHEMAKRYGVKEDTIKKYAQRYGIKKSKGFRAKPIMKPKPDDAPPTKTEMKKRGIHERKQHMKYMKELAALYYPLYSIQEIREKTGLSQNTINNIARSRGLRKYKYGKEPAVSDSNIAYSGRRKPLKRCRN